MFLLVGIREHFNPDTERYIFTGSRLLYTFGEKSNMNLPKIIGIFQQIEIGNVIHVPTSYVQ